MTFRLGEMLLGYRVDPEAGPIVLLAAGGIYTEIYRDRSIRLAPVDLDTARDMIADLAISRIFQGYRNNRTAIWTLWRMPSWRCFNLLSMKAP